MKYEDEFTVWLYNNYTITNGNMLVEFLEDGISYVDFLDEMGLEDDE